MAILVLSSEQLTGQVAAPIHDGDHFDHRHGFVIGIRDGLIEDQVWRFDEHPRGRANVRPRGPILG